jgi:acetyl esterase/lipase
MTDMTRRSCGLLGAAALGFGRPALAHAAGDDSVNGADVLRLVHPDYRRIAAGMLKMPALTLTPSTLPRLRTSQPNPPALPSPSWVQRVVHGPSGAPDVGVYVVNADPKAPPRPAILHMHGGGFVSGTANGSIRMAQEMAAALECVVVTVDYRIAPETTFPGPLEDNYAALMWLYANAAELGVDRSRIAVMGESAGGGHAAMLAIAARDRGEVPLIYQALTYPMLDDRTGSVRKTSPYQGVFIWTAQNNQFGWTSLLGVPAGSSRVPKSSVPAREADLGGLPPAFIGVGSLDLFVNEDIEYVRRLINAGIPVTVEVVPGAFHGFDMMGGRLARQFKSALVAALADAFKVGA